MTRISRFSNPRATLLAVALLTAVMLVFGAFSAEATREAGVAGQAAADASTCQRTTQAPCPEVLLRSMTDHAK